MSNGQGLSATHLQLAWQFPKTLRAIERRHGHETMDRYDGDWEKDIKHGTGVSIEHADAEPIKYHVEYCNGKLKVKKRIALSEELPRELSYKDNDVTVFVGMPLDPNACIVQGTGPFFFSIDPPLPVSLSLDNASGTISGTGKVPLPRTLFIITCHNDASHREGGHASTTMLHITVLDSEQASGWHTKEYEDGSIYAGPCI